MPDRTDAEVLADQLLEAQFDAEPLWPALLGIDVSRPGLGNMTEAEEQHTASVVQGILQRAQAVEPADPQDRLTRDVVAALAQTYLDTVAVKGVEFTVTDLFVAPAVALLTSLPMLTLTNAEQARSYLDRLSAIPEYLQNALERHRAGVAGGRVPVRHLVDAAVAHLDRHLAAPDGDPLLRPEPPEGLAVEFAAERDRILADVVRPGMQAYRDGLAADIAPHARPEDMGGLCWLPDGDATYATMARVHTTTSRTPEDLHQTGLDLVAQLAEEYVVLGERAFGTTDLSEIFQRLRTDQSLRWRSADEMIDTVTAAIERAEQVAPQWFGVIPPQPWVVEPIPESQAPGAPAAYYMQPSTDGSRPGTYFTNTYQVTERFRHTAEVTAFHEAVPGHHFQISLAQGLTSVPMLRRVSMFTAYTEGWGLYTERLADEMGLYSDDVALLGMLSMDSMRAGRLVVDTGLHAKGWSRQQAIDFLRDNSPMPLVEVESEVDRYIAYPGQALSYMVGRLELLRIRAAARQAMGERFDIRAFHDVVLGNGSLPLDVLGSLVGEWAAAR